MNRLYCLAAAALVLVFNGPAKAQESKEKGAAARTLEVKLAYRGAGPVDQKHQIFMFLFDSPEFVNGGVNPIAGKAAASKDATVKFEDLQVMPVYLVAAYDPAGGYDGQSGPPPSGSSMGMPVTSEGKPKPLLLEPGKPVRIVLEFDDSVKMP